jgi:hypothetical protein
MSPLLNLADADTSGFGAIPGGTYDAEIFAAKMEATKGPTENNPNPKLPKGTPMINVQFKIVGGPVPEDAPADKQADYGEGYIYHNRRVFRTFVIPPEKINGKKYDNAARMKGILVRFLQAAGYSDEELGSEEFDLNVEDLASRPVSVVVAMKVKYGLNTEADDFDSNDPENYDNEVTGVKPPRVTAGGSGLT